MLSARFSNQERLVHKLWRVLIVKPNSFLPWKISTTWICDPWHFEQEYSSLILDSEIHLDAMDLEDTVIDKKEASNQDKGYDFSLPPSSQGIKIWISHYKRFSCSFAKLERKISTLKNCHTSKSSLWVDASKVARF